ncbi:MAG TPA: peptidase M48, partial [Cyanothece sp. UBA12306]|nr:peptidase M48 [Cyanothece sp. UBA12306]
MSDRNPPPSNRQLLILLGIFLSFIALIIFSLSIILDWAITQIPISVEQKLGALIVPFYKEQAKSSSEQDSLNRLLDRLEANLDNKLAEKRDYQILYIPEATVNALAIPGEQIIIFEG